MFEKLRKKIVNKLIRPGDGYVYIGDPLYNLDCCAIEGIYLLKRDNNYYRPTITGWKKIEFNEDKPVSINFGEWVCGVLENIYDEHCGRIDNLTRKDMGFKKREGATKVMIRKQSFCDIMEALDKYWDNMRVLEGILNVVFENNVLTQTFEAVIDALESDLEPDLTLSDNAMLYEWLFNMDAGRNEKAKKGIDGHPLTTAEELYDYLIWKRDGEE